MYTHKIILLRKIANGGRKSLRASPPCHPRERVIRYRAIIFF